MATILPNIKAYEDQHVQGQEDTLVRQVCPAGLFAPLTFVPSQRACALRVRRGRASVRLHLGHRCIKSVQPEKDLLRKTDCKAVGKKTGSLRIRWNLGLVTVELSPPLPQEGRDSCTEQTSLRVAFC